MNDAASSSQIVRCRWAGTDKLMVAYHDKEWGVPERNSRKLWETLMLEGFQAGLSWSTILNKRVAFRKGFAGFDPATVAQFGSNDVDRLLGDAGIVRHRGKIEATINNAQRCVELIDEFGSLAAYIWTFEPADRDSAVAPTPLPSQTPDSIRLSKDLKKRGWRFVGPTTVYAFMQAMGLVNDHAVGCEWRAICATERKSLTLP